MNSANDVIQADLLYINEQLRDELTKISGKRVLLTGGAGFLGYYFVQSIWYWNDNNPGNTIELVVYDNFMRGMPVWLDKLSGKSGITVIRHDIREPLPDDMGDFDYVIHGASIASPIYYRKHPIETMDANVNGLRQLLDYCVDQKNNGKSVQAFLFFSTSEIYGDPTPENIPTPETYRGNVSCTGPRACYDESKRYGETLCVNYAKQYNIDIKIVRPFNNYGPGLKISDRRALPDFARNIFNDEDIVLLSDGSPTRTFCYVADAIVGYFKVLFHGRSAESYNIGLSEPEISIRTLAEEVIKIARKLFNYKGDLIFANSDDQEYLIDNPNRRCPNIHKAQEELGYAPTIQLNDGLTRSLLWYSENRHADDS